MLLHAGDLITECRDACDGRERYGFVTRCAPAGAVSSSGSSGITIHAMG